MVCTTIPSKRRLSKPAPDGCLNVPHKSHLSHAYSSSIQQKNATAKLVRDQERRQKSRHKSLDSSDILLSPVWTRKNVWTAKAFYLWATRQFLDTITIWYVVICILPTASFFAFNYSIDKCRPFDMALHFDQRIPPLVKVL